MIKFDGVTKAYQGHVVLDAVDLQAPAGAVTGFLGPNGAGKSTALRILVGLARADSGRATIGGRSYRSLTRPAATVGVLLDADAVHPGRTGRETLALTCIALGLPRRRADEALDRVGLSRREGRQRARGYSLGMRQRLGLAHALLGDPDVLVLDEPANGLDPQGQRWLAELLRDQADRGRTVLLSSHQLAEVEQLADHLVIIGGGRVLSAGTTADLAAAHGAIAEHYFALTDGVDRAAAARGGRIAA
ncbi:ABC transporter ATP-binding protein [Promicromonospora sukumoe]|uniref:ABC transporter ATP-binding protein n=1 Tax=Promicromonospora sukumoe TaxID=88382 RepID=UPI0003772760|nr:ATP-binding cassette domain-containing protein [Promicromonospora sukumoe]